MNDWMRIPLELPRGLLLIFGVAALLVGYGSHIVIDLLFDGKKRR